MKHPPFRVLSSPYTVIWKFVFPATWIALAGAGAIAAAFTVPAPLCWIIPSVWILASTYLLWFALRVRLVSLDHNDNLVISNYKHEITIPLTSVSRISQSYMARPQTITLHLDHDTALGRKVLFVAEGSPCMVSRHPIAEELEEMVAQRKSIPSSHPDQV